MSQVDLDSAPSIRPELNLVLLGGGHDRLARLILRDVENMDDNSCLKFGRGLRKVDIQKRLKQDKKNL